MCKQLPVTLCISIEYIEVEKSAIVPVAHCCYQLNCTGVLYTEKQLFFRFPTAAARVSTYIVSALYIIGTNMNRFR